MYFLPFFRTLEVNSVSDFAVVVYNRTHKVLKWIGRIRVEFMDYSVSELMFLPEFLASAVHLPLPGILFSFLLDFVTLESDCVSFRPWDILRPCGVIRCCWHWHQPFVVTKGKAVRGKPQGQAASKILPGDRVWLIAKKRKRETERVEALFITASNFRADEHTAVSSTLGNSE